MAQTLYLQSGPTNTMTVGRLISLLSDLDENMPIVFQSPVYGCFGSEIVYSVETVSPMDLKRIEHYYPPLIYTDEETGKRCRREEYTQVYNDWHGYVIR